MKIVKFSVMCCMAVMALSGQAFAQERAAGGSLETQMSWAALSNMATAAQTKAQGAHDRIDQSEVCGRLGRIYGTGSGADTLGCRDAMTTSGVKITTIGNSLATISSNVTKIINCNKASKVYNGTVCVTPAATASPPKGTIEIDYKKCARTKFSDQYNGAGADLGISWNTLKYGQHWCQANYTMIGVNNGEVNSALCCKMKFVGQ